MFLLSLLPDLIRPISSASSNVTQWWVINRCCLWLPWPPAIQMFPKISVFLYVVCDDRILPIMLEFWKVGANLFPFSSSPWGERGHLSRLGVLLLRPLAEPHPEQQWRDHALLQDLAAQRPYSAHGQVCRLRQPGTEGRRRVAGHQSRLRGLWGHRGAGQWQIQRQCLAWRQSDSQSQTGNVKQRLRLLNGSLYPLSFFKM